MNTIIQTHSDQLADITSLLFANCQAKELQHAVKYNISIMQFRCLRMLHKCKSLTVNELAREMHLTSGRITRIVDGLVKKRLVLRKIGKEDRRYYNLILTPEGAERISVMINDYHKIHEEIVKTIPEEFRDNLIAMLNLLNRAVEDWLCHGSIENSHTIDNNTI